VNLRPPPELHLVLVFESEWPVTRLVTFTGEDEDRLRAWLRENPRALLHAATAVLVLLNDLLDGRQEIRGPEEFRRLYEDLLAENDEEPAA
jgi:hypothetical protein